MKPHKFSMHVMTGLAAATLMAHISMAEAQITQARTVNMENARRLVPMILDAVNAGKRDEASKRLNEFRENLDIVEAAIYRPARETLHATDKSLLFPKVEDVTNRLGKVRVFGSSLDQQVKGTGAISNSTVSDFKDKWRDFEDGFKRMSDDFNAQWRQIKDSAEKDRVKRLQEVCGRDCA
jgi:hypothetical protein